RDSARAPRRRCSRRIERRRPRASAPSPRPRYPVSTGAGYYRAESDTPTTCCSCPVPPVRVRRQAPNLAIQEDQSLHWHAWAVSDSGLWAAEDVLELVG